MLQRLVASLRKLVVGPLFGDTFPQQPAPARAQQPIDARTGALRALRQYLEGVTYFLPAGEGKPTIPFRVDHTNWLIKAPEGEHVMKLPSLQVVGGPGQAEPFGLTSVIVESSRDLFGQGTALQWHHTYVENFGIEVWASTEPELRSIVAGLEQAFNPTEGRAGVILRCPEYFDLTARFLLKGRENFNDTDAARNRRKATIKVDLDINVVSLVRVVPFSPQALAEVATYSGPGCAPDNTVLPPDAE